MIRESFVVHAEYLLDIPEENKLQFYSYILEYGIFGAIPNVKGFELKAWNNVQRRIDLDASTYDEQKNKKLLWKAKNHAKEGRATPEEIELLKKWELWEVPRSPKKSQTDTVTNTNTPSVIVNDTVIDNVSVIDNVIDIDIDNVSVSDAQKDYAHQIFSLFSSAGLPCCNNNELSFIQKDFMQGLQYVRGINSSDVIQAIKNYIDVITDNNCYYSHKYSFDRLLVKPIFKDFLPENFDKKNFLKFSKGKEEEEEPEWLEKYKHHQTPEEYLEEYYKEHPEARPCQTM